MTEESWATDVYITKLCGTCIEREGDFISKHIKMLMLPPHILVTVSPCVVWIGSLVGHGQKGIVVVISSLFWVFVAESWVLESPSYLSDVSNSYDVTF